MKRKTAYLEHVIRNNKYKFLQLLIEGKVEGMRGIGRKKMAWLRSIRQWTRPHDLQSLMHTARNRQGIENAIANIALKEEDTIASQEQKFKYTVCFYRAMSKLCKTEKIELYHFHFWLTRKTLVYV